MSGITIKRALGRAARISALFTCAFVANVANAASATEAFWNDAAPHALSADAPPVSTYRALDLDVDRIGAELAQIRANGRAITLALPRPEGGFSEFELVDSRTMPKALADRHPDIISLVGSDGHGAKVRVDRSSLGFQAMVFGRDGVWIVRPETPGGGRAYLSFRRADLAVSGAAFQCGVHDADIDASGRNLLAAPQPMTTTGAIERDYRAAVAANHQYVAAAGGGTLEGGLASVVQAMNRVNQVYETEFAVHMTLIADEDSIIYPTAAGDPYSNDGNALDQNQTNLDAVIGSANYDIGHVFTTGSGGVAGLRVTCLNGQKASGTTGLPNPTGDAFYIDYVAHEMGHQFGGNHTFNSTQGACGGGNRAGSAAYEPGSGSTIMAYAGICGADDLQPHSDPYFHAKSLEEMSTWINGNGGSCAVQTTNPDTAPLIDTTSLPDGFTIPVQTAFALSGVASDVDDDDLTYNWEQYDRGSASRLNQGDIGNGPIFRSFNATTSETRYFPQLSTILGGTPAKGEAMPTTNRDLTFRLTVRDNLAIGGRSQSADMVLHVVDTAGPFAVTRPNTNIAWGRGESHIVTWDVANTDVAPVSCSDVAIDLSDDGGQTFAYSLATSVPNSGSTEIVVPDAPDSTAARVRVSCADNVFLDVSDVDFTIAAVGDADPVNGFPHAQLSTTALDFALEFGAASSATFDLGNTGDVGTTLTYTITASASGCSSPSAVGWLAIPVPSGSILAGATSSIEVDADAAGLAAGDYTASLCIASNDPAQPVAELPVTLNVAAEVNDVIFSDSFDVAH